MEAYIEGYANEYEFLEDLLKQELASKFGAGILGILVIGTEAINTHPNRRVVIIKGRSPNKSSWRQMKLY